MWKYIAAVCVVQQKINFARKVTTATVGGRFGLTPTVVSYMEHGTIQYKTIQDNTRQYKTVVSCMEQFNPNTTYYRMWNVTTL